MPALGRRGHQLPDRLLDPPLHEFNPMLGHRGCRLGITYPEISRMQARAIFEAALQVSCSPYRVPIARVAAAQPFAAAVGSTWQRMEPTTTMGTTSLALAVPGLGFASPCNPLALQSVLSDETAQAMAPPSDRTLAERAMRGDSEAFAELYRRYERPIFNFILRSVGQRALAEELLQETFTRVWRVGGTFDGAYGSFRSWLYKVALNTLRSELRKRRYAAEHVPLEDLEAEASAARPPDDPAAELDLSAQAPSVARALDGLAPYFKEVVILRCYQQLTFAEIALITGAPEGTLKARFHRAVAALRTQLGVAGKQP